MEIAIKDPHHFAGIAKRFRFFKFWEVKTSIRLEIIQSAVGLWNF